MRRLEGSHSCPGAGIRVLPRWTGTACGSSCWIHSGGCIETTTSPPAREGRPPGSQKGCADFCRRGAEGRRSSSPITHWSRTARMEGSSTGGTTSFPSPGCGGRSSGGSPCPSSAACTHWAGGISSGGNQDLSGPRNRVMVREVKEALSGEHRPLIHAAGHDHNLQVLHGVAWAEYALVSGSGSKTSKVGRGQVRSSLTSTSASWPST